MAAKIHHQTVIHKGRAFRFVKETVTLENGVTVDLELVRHPGASAMVPFIRKDTLILLKQYRHAVGRFIWEIPAGTLSPNETPMDCARRELVEETGYSANTWKKLGEITPVPGYSDERIHIFLAKDLASAEQNLDKDEVLDVHEIRFKEALKMIARGDIQDGKTICGLHMAANHV